jgi:hypothetical protein
MSELQDEMSWSDSGWMDPAPSPMEPSNPSPTPMKSAAASARKAAVKRAVKVAVVKKAVRKARAKKAVKRAVKKAVRTKKRAARRMTRTTQAGSEGGFSGPRREPQDGRPGLAGGSAPGRQEASARSKEDRQKGQEGGQKADLASLGSDISLKRSGAPGALSFSGQDAQHGRSRIRVTRRSTHDLPRRRSRSDRWTLHP